MTPELAHLSSDSAKWRHKMKEKTENFLYLYWNQLNFGACYCQIIYNHFLIVGVKDATRVGASIIHSTQFHKIAPEINIKDQMYSMLALTLTSLLQV